MRPSRSSLSAKQQQQLMEKRLRFLAEKSLNEDAINEAIETKYKNDIKPMLVEYRRQLENGLPQKTFASEDEFLTHVEDNESQFINSLTEEQKATYKKYCELDQQSLVIHTEIAEFLKEERKIVAKQAVAAMLSNHLTIYNSAPDQKPNHCTEAFSESTNKNGHSSEHQI